MKYYSIYHSFIGDLYLFSDSIYLIGLYLKDSKYFKKINIGNFLYKEELPIFNLVKRYLESYFNKERPILTDDILKRLKFNNNLFNDFDKKVYEETLKIKYGRTTTYSDIAKKIDISNKNKFTSLRVGTSLAKNPFLIIIPCHRVIAKNNDLKGFAANLENKIKLLTLEDTYLNDKFISFSEEKNIKRRCKWAKENNYLYLHYHDFEWGRKIKDEHYLYMMFILETFQAGLSWEIILNKREAFKKAYDNFDIEKIIKYDEKKIDELLKNKNLIRNKAKIKASITNSIIYNEIVKDYSSFYSYLNSYFKDKIIYENDKTTNKYSDEISDDLIKRGMKFVGSTTIYSFLQAVGFISSHSKDCFLYNV